MLRFTPKVLLPLMRLPLCGARPSPMPHGMVRLFSDSTPGQRRKTLEALLAAMEAPKFNEADFSAHWNRNDWRDSLDSLKEQLKGRVVADQRKKFESLFSGMEDILCNTRKSDDMVQDSCIINMKLIYDCLQPSDTLEAYFRSLQANHGVEYWSGLLGVRSESLSEKALNDAEAGWSARVCMPESSEVGRVVATGFASRTPFVNKIRVAIESATNKAVVVSGESGSGKTFAALMAAASIKNDAFVVYIPQIENRTVIEHDSKTAEEINELPNEERQEIQKKKNKDDEMVASWIVDRVRKLISNGTSEVGQPIKGIKESPDATVTVVIDEMGSRPDVLRCLCRIMRESGTALNEIKTMLRVGHIRLVAVGTGCDDTLSPPGSRPDDYNIVRSNPKDAGHALWIDLADRLVVQSKLTDEQARFARYLVTACGGDKLPQTNSTSEKKPPVETKPSAIMKDVRRVPSGRLLATRGCALVGNARLAALMMANVRWVVEGLPARFCAATDGVVVAATAVSIAEGVLALAIQRFVFLNALSTVYDTAEQRLGAAVQAMALMLGVTDAPLPADLLQTLVVRTGLLTHHAVKMEAEASSVPKTQRVCAHKEGNAMLVVEDGLQRYRVTPAVVAMYLLSFGARHRSTEGGAYEALLGDYLMAAAPAAACVAEWARSDNAGMRALATPCEAPDPTDADMKALTTPCEAPDPTDADMKALTTPCEAPEATDATKVGPRRNALFSVLVEAFGRGEKGEVSRVHRRELTKRFGVGEGGASLRSLHDVWQEATAKKPTDATALAIITNAARAPGPDVLVLSPRRFSLFLRVKSYQKTATSAAALLGEFVKMGAPPFDKELVDAVAKDKKFAKQYGKAEWDELMFDEERRKAYAACFADSSAFPHQYFVIARCMANGKGVGSHAVFIDAVLEAHKGTHEGCLYVETHPGDTTMEPVSMPMKGDEEPVPLDLMLK